MLDQLRRLVSGSSNNGGHNDGIPPSGNQRQSRNHIPSSGSRSGSLSRLTAYALHPQHSGRVRMQLSYGVVPVSYGPPPPVVGYSRNGRPVVGYDPWYQVRYQSAHPPHPAPPRTPVARQLSARPDLTPPPPLSTSSAGKKKLDKERKDVFHHPTLRRDTVVPNSRNRLVSSRSLDSIHPHRIHPVKEKQDVEVKSSSKKVKDFFQRVKDSVSNGSSQSNKTGGQGQRTDEWLLLRPSLADSSKPLPPPQRPTTPGIAAFRKIFSRSPSPTPIATSTPVKKPLSSTKSLFQQIIRPRSRSVSSTASLSVRSHSTHSGGIRTKAAASTTDLNVVHQAGSTQRGHPDGATFPRDSPHPPIELNNEIYAPVSEPAQPTVILPGQNGQSKRSKFVKKTDQQPAFRVRRRQSQLRRSERKRRSSRRRSGRKKNRSKKLGSTKGSQLGSQSALSGAKLVSDWTYLPLPTSFTPTAIEEPVVTKELETAVQQDDGWESDLYQVLVDRPRRSLPPPMWDPLIFIPPERRRSTVAVNGSSILNQNQPWIRSSKLRADGKKQHRRINPPLSPSSSRSASSGKTLPH